jgi:ferredoxin
VNKFDDIAVTNCYCRHEKELLKKPCKLNAPKENCLMFGKMAQFAIEYGFAKSISKEDTIKLLKEAEDHGLVHQAFHQRFNPEMDEEAICSCCKCCCGVFDLFYRGFMPYHVLTSYLARVDEDLCIGCGTCVEKCPMEAIELEDNKAVVNEDRCIGCGVCAHHCPEDAMKLERTGPRDVFIPPPKLES